MLKYDFEASIGYWVIISSLAFRRALNEELAPHGITFRQSQVLGWLVLEGELSQGELASRMEVEPPTLAGLVDRMENAGWVTRCVCPDDRRKKIIRLQDQAGPVWEKIAECARRVRKVATRGLTDEQSDQLLSLLRVVHGNLTQSIRGMDPPTEPK
ncbi:Transcriptional regulator SlyA [Maioricimonas rarisocia]|uniref:Transcriptional regulator SlyA n=1 Tax=Maioricimonas rarisocia TaxID=2528026 RepID=A0A517ZA62_9PLAN|nr:MarR family transcriptional regulator [Maioricimonas rarisocia]QDU39368.1 Transcriptional regulator SlyA [Maioricimonas rarisocia]